ncbi:MAG: hypothetical protein FGM46_03750 [Ferruginibacter sp.]|nr:hypothetical protein [Ferruginibacter sp.]
MIQNQVKELLTKSFSHWSEKQVNDFISFFQSYSCETKRNYNYYKGGIGKLIAEDPNLIDSILLESISAIYENKKNEIKSIDPGYLRRVFENNIKKYFKKSKKKIKEPFEEYLLYSIEFATSIRDFDESDTLTKVSRFAHAIKNSIKFSGGEEIIFDLLIQIALEEQETEGSKKKDIWKEVKERLSQLNYLISDSSWGTLKKRVIEKIQKNQADSKNLLHFIPKEQEAEKEALELFETILLSYYNNTSNPVNAYRLSQQEMEKMIWLKQIFESNNYSFDPNRFPEIYYEDYQKVEEYYDKAWDEIRERDRGVDEEIDYLGFYIPKDYNPIYNFTKTHEGIIVLFKDRIEEYCERNSKNVDDVRFVVLMHELGHWLTHWAKFKDAKSSLDRWIYGMNLYPITRYTHEALAQLITYWACDGNPVHEKTLFDLSPKGNDRKVDPSAIYGGYIQLTGKSKSEILLKISELRTYWIFNDEKMLEFLKSDNLDMKAWKSSHPDKPKDPRFKTGIGWDKWIDAEIINELVKRININEYFSPIIEKKAPYEISKGLKDSVELTDDKKTEIMSNGKATYEKYDSETVANQYYEVFKSMLPSFE